MMTLYDAFVPGCLQILESVSRLVAKAKTYCDQHALPHEHLLQAKLAPDMLDFAYQVKSCAVHSIGAIRGVQSGNFSPDQTMPPDSFEGLAARMAETIDALRALEIADVEGLSERQMTFTIGDKLRWNLLGKDFLLSFSQPNFYFHAATAYDILRASGVPLGKRDYLGAVRKLP
ncbi:DUF1993 domain-containing protein [Sphingobium indicum]|uniref:DUF1993 domain-containing protein n=2 Tax=Sphingobium indicum TaxID=332055 RepID=A0A1L5BNK9_SPHIB|nr:DUF1993 domain-containing protein [Sphingobium indicum]APL94485.1 hypothetical protein SIDU_08225 [Sphingobium indicum B90A]KEY97733.1 hypothetical protein AI27_16760 [Sphingomonas sp. BHC-A]NYI23389.1 hypothetical protein [Sphingobium indicum]RYM04230.1 DUF1993 domain-containing protein [Sphingobium indicum]